MYPQPLRRSLAYLNTTTLSLYSMYDGNDVATVQYGCVMCVMRYHNTANEQKQVIM